MEEEQEMNVEEEAQIIDTPVAIHQSIVGPMGYVHTLAPNVMPNETVIKIMRPLTTKWVVVHHTVEIVVNDGVG